MWSGFSLLLVCPSLYCNYNQLSEKEKYIRYTNRFRVWTPAASHVTSASGSPPPPPLPLRFFFPSEHPGDTGPVCSPLRAVFIPLPSAPSRRRCRVRGGLNATEMSSSSGFNDEKGGSSSVGEPEYGHDPASGGIFSSDYKRYGATLLRAGKAGWQITGGLRVWMFFCYCWWRRWEWYTTEEQSGANFVCY